MPSEQIYLMVIVLRQLVEGILQPENVTSQVVPAADALRHRRSGFDGGGKDEERSVMMVHPLDFRFFSGFTIHCAEHCHIQ